MYTHTWNKYLPVIRILMKRSAVADQKIDLNRIDFENGSRNRKLSCSFNIGLEKGRLSAITQSATAKDLLAVLLRDDMTNALLKQNLYEFSLNSRFQLTIKNTTPATLPIREDVSLAGMETEESLEEEAVLG